MIARAGGRSDSARRTAPCASLNSGRYFDTGSVRLKRPASWSIMTATAVTGLVIE